MRRIVLATLIVLFVSFAVIGIANKPLIGISVIGTEHDWDIQAYNGAISRARELGADVLAFDGERRVDKMVSDIQTLINRRVDLLIVILGYRDAIEPLIMLARDRGIPVVTVDFRTPYSISNVETNNFTAMAELVLKMVSDLRGEGEVGIFYRPGSPIAEMRKKVFDMVLSEFPGVKVVAQEAYVLPGTVPDAYNKTRDMLRANPNIQAFWTVFDMPMIGAAQAIADLGMADSVQCYGFDGDPTAMEMIADPTSGFAATVAQQPFLIGQTAVDVAFDILAGKEVPPMVFVPHVLVTRDNVQEVLDTLPQYQ